jgi:hypothetical protein
MAHSQKRGKATILGYRFLKIGVSDPAKNLSQYFVESLKKILGYLD